MKQKIIFHGSENSLDTDAYIIIESPLSLQESKKICDSHKDINANLITVESGQINWCYKGTIDECNNSILHTYHLHKQIYKNPIQRPMERSYALKTLRTLRGLLSHNSRTEYRADVKKALKSNLLENKINVLKNINLNKINDFKKNDLIETYKFFAFQLGQTRALIEDNKELFTKNSVGEYYPFLKSYLMREKQNPDKLNCFWHDFLNLIEYSIKKVEKHDLYFSKFNNKKEVFECKNEKILPPVVIFDIDNTLLDETHRAYLREEGKLKEYFSLCELDTPIKEIIELTHNYKNKGYEVWIMSGRSDEVLEKTINSLKEHNVHFDHIKLRSQGNKLPDYVLKPAWARNLIGIERINFVYDDQKKVIEGFKRKGLNVIDVNNLKKEQFKNKNKL